IPFCIMVPYCGTSVFIFAIFDLPFLITCSFRIYTLFLSESTDLIKDTAYVKQRARHPCLAPASFSRLLFYAHTESHCENALPIVLTSSSGLLYLTFA